ncbi:MAG: hypothetical protein WCH20_16910, partial [Nitrospira sp.]
MVSHGQSTSVFLPCQTVFAHLIAGLSCVVIMASQVQAADQTASQQIANRVDGHLAAGEFGPALDLARNVADPLMQAALVEKV